MVTWVF